MVNLMGSSLSQHGLSSNPDSRGSRLIVSSEYDPWSILEMTYTYLSGSASMVFHCPHLQVRPRVHGPFIRIRLRDPQILVDLQAQMRNAGGYLGTNITEAWKRKYQVRSHPSMRVSSNSPERLAGAPRKDTPDNEHVWHWRVYLARFQDVCYSFYLGPICTPVLTSPSQF